jgi:DNA polymerase theta
MNELKIVSMLVIDEVQFVGDEQRGVLLEILIAKVLYSQRYYEVQILAISATIDNFSDFVTWMKAKCYECSKSCTNIEEYVKVDSKLVGSSGKFIKLIKEQSNDKYKICTLVDSVLNKGPILIFSPSKFTCEEIAKTLSNHITNEVNTIEFLKNAIDKAEFAEARMTNEVKWLVKGIACHHAELLAEERLFIENLYRSLAINTLICTSTLAAGINLPANIVVIVGLTQGASQITISTYKQMRGRAGRTTFKGQCYIICRDIELSQALKLINSVDVQSPVFSTLDKDNNGMRRLLLEGIALKYIKDNVKTYIDFTLLNTRSYEVKVLDDALKFLVEYELIVEESLIATQLGTIIARSGHHIEEMLIAYWELQAANIKYLPCNRAFALYLISPIFCINETQASWVHYLSYYKKHLDEHKDLKETANYLSIDEDYLIAWTQIMPPDLVRSV